MYKMREFTEQIYLKQVESSEKLEFELVKFKNAEQTL
jgi:hypothetical protein